MPWPSSRGPLPLIDDVFLNTFGFGLIITSMVLYFTRVVHLSAVQVGLGMTIAGLIGLIAGVPVGDLADRHGPRVVVRVTFLVSFLATLAYLFIRDWDAFVAVATILPLGHVRDHQSA
jgi:predicted MFS family arabinose efflux permease